MIQMSSQNAPQRNETESEMTVDDVLNEMDKYRRDMLTHLYHADHGQLGSTEIADRAGVKRGSKHAFLSDLRRWGLIEKRGERESGPGSSIDEYIYGITENGRTIVAEHLEDVRPAELGERVELLESQVDELQDEKAGLRREIESLHQKQEENSERLDGVRDLLNGDYWDRIVSEIKRRSQ